MHNFLQKKAANTSVDSNGKTVTVGTSIANDFRAMRHYLPLFLRRTLAKLFARHFKIKQILILVGLRCQLAVFRTLYIYIYIYIHRFIRNKKSFRILCGIYDGVVHEGQEPSNRTHMLDEKLFTFAKPIF